MNCGHWFWHRLLLPLLFWFFAVALVMIPACRQLFERSLPSMLLDKVKHWAGQVFECFDRYKAQPGLLVYSLILAISFQLLRIVLFFLAALMIGESPLFIYFVVFVPVVIYAALLPISIGGLGLREAGLVFLFMRFDVMDSAPTFTIAILVFVSGLLSTLPGGWFYVRQRRRLKAVMERART